LPAFGLLTFVPQLFDVNSREVTIPFRVVVLVFSLLLLFVAIRNRILHTSLGLFLFSFFWVLLIARLVADIFFLQNAHARPPEMYFFQGIGMNLIPALSFFTLPDLRALRRTRGVLICFMSVLCAITFAGGQSNFAVSGGRLSGNQIWNPISVGHMGASLAILSAHSYLTLSRNGLSIRTLLLGLMALGVATALFSGSRSPLLAMIVVACLLGAAAIAERGYGKVIVILLMLAIWVPVIINQVTGSGGSLVDRVSYLGDEKNVRGDLRLDLWQQTWHLFAGSPILGNSIDIPDVGYPHNILLESLMATGAMGGVLMLVLIFYGVKQSLQMTFAGYEYAWVGLLFLQYLISAQFSGTAYENAEFWCLYAAVVSVQEANRGNAEVRRNELYPKRMWQVFRVNSP
jgi:O-antigen ligase